MRIAELDIARRGILFIVSGPSGAGKTSLSSRALTELSGLELSVSLTTRAPREGEADGVAYHFVTQERFRRMVDGGELAEWAEVHGNYYGTPRAPIDGALAEGRDLLLDIDVQGARQIKGAYPEAVAIFLLPPDRAQLEQRLAGRGTDAPEVVAERLRNACGEIASLTNYDYAVVNDDLVEAYGAFESIVRAERCRRTRVSAEDWTRVIDAFGESS